MRFFSPVLRSLAKRANALVAQAEFAHPGMREVAAMVYIGDVYALREQGSATKREARARRRAADSSPGRS